MYKFFGSIILCCCVWSSGGLALNCVKTDDCSSLGYKQTSVDNDLPKLKCPHGEGYYYSCNNTFKYTCTNQAESPSGKECLGLYEKCNCEKGYIWLYGKCQKTCEIGDIYYIDGTCGSADEYDKSKKVLGVVVYLNASKIHGLIMAAVAEEMTSSFGSADYDSFATINDPEKDYSSCTNTKYLAQISSPAAIKAQGYQISSDTLGKWCLPASGIWYEVSQNLVKINYTMKALGTLPLSGNYWSSTLDREISTVYKYYWNAASNSFQQAINAIFNIRPVLEFQKGEGR